MNLAAHIGEQTKRVNLQPTEGQKRAGNYQKGHIKVHGLDVAIENPRGSERSGTSPGGKKWTSRLPHHYGYVKGSEGADGQHVDVFIGPHLKAPKVYVIDQHDPRSGEFDEHKCMIGFGSRTQATEAYARAFSDKMGHRRIGHVESMNVDDFKGWLRNGDTKAPVRRAAGGGVESGPPAFEETSEVPPFDQTKPVSKSIGERISNAWEKATPGGPLWMIRQGVRGMRGAVEGSKAAVAPQVGTEEDEFLRRQSENVGPGRAMEAAQFMTPGAPGGGFLAVPRVAPSVKPIPPEVMANKNAASEFDIPLSRGQATQNLDTIRYEDMAARGGYGKPAQDRAAPFFDDQYGATQEAGKKIGTSMADAFPVSNPNEAASAITNEMGSRVGQARTIVDRVLRRSTDEAATQRGVVEDQGRVLNDVVRGRAQPIENPREMGEVVGQNVRDAAAANRQERTGLYNEVRDLPGEFRVDAVRGLGTRVRNSLDAAAEPIVIDDQLTPAASRAIQALDVMSVPRIQNRASPHAEPDPSEIMGVSLRGIDQMRKKLISYYQAARANPTDARAVQGIIHEFDGQIERAITEGLFSGDPRALTALQEARASHARYRSTFGPQRQGDDVGTAMRRIVERNATPEETANMIIGSGKVGAAGTPVRLADRLEQVLGADSDGWSAIRQAIWGKVSGQMGHNGGPALAPDRLAQNIMDFIGSSLGQRMFSPQERAAMRSHAQGVRDLERSIASHPATQEAERAQQMFEGAFGGRDIGGQQQTVFRRIIDGTATPEEVSGVVFSAIGGGNPGNTVRMIKAIEKVVGSQSESMSALRQGIWQKTIANTEGRSGKGQQAVVNNISELLNGKGRSVAEALYTPEQRAMMDRYAQALKLTIIPKFARTNSDTAPAIMGALHKYGSAIMGSLGAILSGGLEGGLAGVGVKHMLAKGGEKFTDAMAARKVGQSLDDLQPQQPKLLPPKTGLPPYLLRSLPYKGPNLGSLQGPVSGRAEEEQQRP